MKLRTLGFVALAATLGLASCQKEDVKVDGETKAVAIKLLNIKPATKTLNQEVADNEDVAVSSFQVFFAEGDINSKLHVGDWDIVNGAQSESKFYYTTADMDGTGTTAEGNTIKKEHVYHYVPDVVTKVYALGNIDAEKSVKTDGTSKLSDFFTNLSIDNQQTVNSLALFAESEISDTPAADADANGHAVYSANLVLAPRVSRIEIENFKYLPTPDDNGDDSWYFDNIVVKNVFFNNFYRYADYVSNTIVTSGIENESSYSIAKSIDKYNVFKEMEALSTSDKASDLWYFDAVSNVTLSKKTATGNENNHDFDATSRPAYNFFATGVTDSGLMPQLVIELEGTRGSDKYPLWLATNGFTVKDGEKGKAIDTDATNVYKVNFEFNDDNLTNPEKCVDVTVSVAKWAEVVVTPEFK